jgi:hypothetical protein
MRWTEKGRFEMLGHYDSLWKSGKQNIPACLSTSTDGSRQPAHVEFGDLLTTRSFHASVGDAPM